MVNACRKPGEWQTYDIIFESPRFDDNGKLLKPGIATVLQNGVVVQNHSEMIRATPVGPALPRTSRIRRVNADSLAMARQSGSLPQHLAPRDQAAGAGMSGRGSRG